MGGEAAWVRCTCVVLVCYPLPFPLPPVATFAFAPPLLAARPIGLGARALVEGLPVGLPADLPEEHIVLKSATSRFDSLRSSAPVTRPSICAHENRDTHMQRTETLRLQMVHANG